MIPTLTEALSRLEANPAVAAEYDAAMRREAPGKSRREAVQATLDAFAAKRRENEAMRAKLVAARQRIAALERAKAAQATLKAELSQARGKLIVAQAKAGKRKAPAGRFAGASDNLVMQAAVHRSSSDADKLEARAELEKRGFIQLPKGAFSKSI
jgi:hypothetical protein